MEKDLGEREGVGGSGRDPVEVARAYGVDLGLLVANLKLTTTERLRLLDAMVSFAQRVRHV
jgi:hypothetical protein